MALSRSTSPFSAPPFGRTNFPSCFLEDTRQMKTLRGPLSPSFGGGSQQNGIETATLRALSIENEVEENVSRRNDEDKCGLTHDCSPLFPILITKDG